MNMMERVTCRSLFGDEIEEVVAVEENVTVHVRGRVSHLRCTPDNLEALGAGYAVTEGYLKANEVSNVRVEGRNIFVEYSNPRDRVEGGLERVDVNDIIRLTDMLKDAKTWNLTAGTHSAILKGKKTYFCEDVSRSCAVDKVVGMAVLDESALPSSVLVVSCRLSELIVRKALNAGIPVVVSKAAVTTAGIRLAEKGGITLVGFVRGGNGKVFTHPERLP